MFVSFDKVCAWMIIIIIISQSIKQRNPQSLWMIYIQTKASLADCIYTAPQFYIPSAFR